MDLVTLNLNQTKELKILNDLLANYEKVYRKNDDPEAKAFMRYSMYLVIVKINNILLGKPAISEKFRNKVESSLKGGE